MSLGLGITQQVHAFGLCTIHYKSRTHSYCLFMLSYAPHRAEPFWHHKIPDAVSVRQIYYIPVSSSIVPCNHNKASEMHFNAFQCIAQPNTVLHDCILYLPQYYDPGISPGSANQCILGGVYLRSNISRNTTKHVHHMFAFNWYGEDQVEDCVLVKRQQNLTNLRCTGDAGFAALTWLCCFAWS